MSEFHFDSPLPGLVDRVRSGLLLISYFWIFSISLNYRFDAIVVGAGGAGLRAAFGLGEPMHLSDLFFGLRLTCSLSSRSRGWIQDRLYHQALPYPIAHRRRAGWNQRRSR